MVIDISTQQIIVTLLLGTIAYIGSKYFTFLNRNPAKSFL